MRSLSCRTSITARFARTSVPHEHEALSMLIHGDVGANRSAAIAAALSPASGGTLIEVVRLLKERRPRCLTNKGASSSCARRAG